MTVTATTEEVPEASALLTEAPAVKRRKIVLAFALFGLPIVGILVAVAVLISIGCDDIPKERRVNCSPDRPDLTRDQCHERGCCYDDERVADGVPRCFLTADMGYSVESNMTSDRTGIRASMTYVKGMNLKGLVNSERLDLKISFLTDELIHIQYRDPARPPSYTIPVPINIPSRDIAQHPLYKVDMGSGGFRISRRSTNVTLMDTRNTTLLHSSQLKTLTTPLPSTNFYGLGEQFHPRFKHDFGYKMFPMFARDNPTGEQNANFYGTHPFYECVEDAAGNTHGVLFWNSNAQEIALSPLPQLTYRTFGGSLEFFMFLGPSPEKVVQDYTHLIGRPHVPPYWSLGFHLCKYGYNSLDTLKTVVNRNLAAKVPLEVQYADIDHMDERVDFTVSKDFVGLGDYFRELRQRGMRTIIILDPAIITNLTNYPPYDRGIASDVFIKWPTDQIPAGETEIMHGYVWPKGKVAFPDFFYPATKLWWKEQITAHFSVVPFDGLWIDMNEPANFGTNEERPWNWPTKDTPYWSLKCPTGPLDDPPIRPMGIWKWDNGQDHKRMSDKTICMIAQQRGANGESYNHYDVHNLYGYSEGVATFAALEAATKERAFVISRSTFPGSGVTASHWYGDNHSSWDHLRQSIIAMLEFNLFGIPMSGADICGFGGDTTPELCLRWMQLGAFYPYMRNHNAINQKDQDPAFFSQENHAEVTKASVEAIQTRYQLLPYLYGLLYAAWNHGGTVARPLFHEFPGDATARTVDEAFMWGPALYITPVVYEGETEVKAYLPSKDSSGVAVAWYDYYDGARVPYDGTVTIPVEPTSRTPLFTRGGFIIPKQEARMTVAESKLTPLTLLVSLSAEGKASGTYFFDNGVGTDNIENDEFYLATLDCVQTSTGGKFTLQPTVANEATISTIAVEKIVIYGMAKEPKSTTTNSFAWDGDLKVLTISWNSNPSLTNDLNGVIEVSWTF